MHCRFIIKGGWERSVPSALPGFREVMSASNPITVTERVFVRERRRTALGVYEYIYVEQGTSSQAIVDHECAELARARLRIDELEALCDRAYDVVQDNEVSFVSMFCLLSGTPGKDLDKLGTLQSELKTIAMKRRAQGRVSPG